MHPSKIPTAADVNRSLLRIIIACFFGCGPILYSHKGVLPRRKIVVWLSNKIRQAMHAEEEKIHDRCHKKIGTPIFRHPRATNPRILGTPIPIFLGLPDPTCDLRPENWNPRERTSQLLQECSVGMLHRTKRKLWCPDDSSFIG